MGIKNSDFIHARLAMDYSASINDADNPVGPSPWGNSPESSPRPNRTNFGALGSEPPPSSPFPFASQAGNNGLAAGPEEGGFGAGETNYTRPDTASTTSAAETAVEAQVGEPEPAEVPPTQPGQEDNQQQQPSQMPSEPVEERGPQDREQQIRRPLQSQYRLQAKITGLERAGRKDPILRFDVHVGRKLPAYLGRAIN